MHSAKTLFTPQWFFLVLLVIGTPTNVESWSLPSPTSSSLKNNSANINNPIRDDENTNENNKVSSRRQLFQQSAAAATAVIVASPSDANAACLQGDLRSVCIGIYKVPLDDNILPYISTPEQLHKFAPDLHYVPPIEYPKSFESAIAILQAQRAAADEIKQHVMAGKLEEAGIQVLGLIPQVNSGCRRVFSDLEDMIRTKGIVAGKPKTGIPSESETTAEMMAIEMAEDQMNYVNGYWGDCDITIGQGIRGELGRLTVAQLTILASLRDATCALDDFLVTAVTLSKTRTAA
jgi:hypothetical protein